MLTLRRCLSGALQGHRMRIQLNHNFKASLKGYNVKEWINENGTWKWHVPNISVSFQWTINLFS
jgi:hypothetical protein